MGKTDFHPFSNLCKAYTMDQKMFKRNPIVTARDRRTKTWSTSKWAVQWMGCPVDETGWTLKWIVRPKVESNQTVCSSLVIARPVTAVNFRSKPSTMAEAVQDF